jgi:hypothetical protein
MRTVVSLLLAIVIPPAGVPHALCTCGCADGGQAEAGRSEGGGTTGCPLCCGRAPRDESNDSPPVAPEPCKCGSCDQRAALTTHPVVAGGGGSPGLGNVPADFDGWLPAVTPQASPSVAASPAAQSFALPVRALPVLLGHLLF